MNYLIGHLVGDYLIQNDWMAQNKKTRTIPCLVHVALYSLSIWGFTRWPWWAIAITFGCHFTQDRTNIVRGYMTFIRQPKFMQAPLAPWSFIVVDNVFHLLQLFITEYLVRHYL